MYSARVIRLAKRDINEAAHWYDSQHKGLGKRFTRSVREKVIYIQHHPKLFAVFHTSRDPFNWEERL